MSAGQPPSHEARLTLYLALVEDYRLLARTLPVPPQLTLGSVDRRDPTDDYWRRLLRAFALRKFVSPKDHVTVVKVVRSLNALVPEETDQIRAEMDDLVARAERGVGAFGTGVSGQYEHADGITRDILYGRYLHGDYGRWVRSRARPILYEEMSLWSWVSNVEALVYSVERTILGLRDAGALELPDSLCS